MRYYKVSLLNSPLECLTYKSKITYAQGDIVEVPFKNAIKRGVIISQTHKPSFETKDMQTKTNLFFPVKYQQIVKFICNYYVCSLGEAYSLFMPFDKGKERVWQAPKERNFTLKELSNPQKKAFDFLQKNSLSLLFGDTGSGKTEVYIHLIAEVLKQGKSIIFLMPEISLTPQMQKRLKEIFGDEVALWHSKVTKKKKEEILSRLKEGSIKIVAGARSALFLPVLNLGLIIVDEEHDSSYKSNSRPRYNARDLAVYFGKILGCKVVLGSATPSLTSYQKYPLFRLKGSFAGLKKEYIYEKNSEDLSENVINELSQILKEKKQAIVFLPTRANFKYISCFDCGEFISCPFCSVGLSLHKDKNALICHYCGYIQRIPKECPSCKSKHLSSFRMGTEEVRQRLASFFPNATIQKFDRDAIKSTRELNRVLKEFNEEKIDILVGTQMLSKGHDYKGIGLSVILGIDNILAQNDFRSRENALSLAVQISGRSGRAGVAKVILQTSNEEFFKRYMDDYELFLKDELKYRKDLYPPYKKLVRLLISHKQDIKAKEILQNILSCLQTNLEKEVEIVGSGEANIKKIASKYRYQILLRSTSSKALLKTISKCKQTHCEVDMDPISFS